MPTLSWGWHFLCLRASKTRANFRPVAVGETRRGCRGKHIAYSRNKYMNKKHVITAVIIGALAGYALQNYIARIPVVNKVPVLGAK